MNFAAWSLYTGPSCLNPIINDPACPWVVGRWDGINESTSKEEIKKDLDYRISAVIQYFKQCIPLFTTYCRNFVIPEFFFHCAQGPYPNIRVDDVLYPFEYIIAGIKKKLDEVIPDDNNYYTVIVGSTLTSNIEDYASFLTSAAVLEREAELNALLPNNLQQLMANRGKIAPWKRLIVPTENTELKALNAFMKHSRANPLCIVRNRGAYFHFNRTMMKEIEVFIYEKQNESTVDLTMGMFDSNGRVTTNGMITEWLGNYPSYSILGGDKQTSQLSTAARFSPQFIGNSDIGVEVCLDHRLQRLRRTVNMCVLNGADADNFPIARQFIPSGGMQILDYSVAGDPHSYIFNADGCASIYTDYTDPNSCILNGESGQFKGITCGVYALSLQSKWTGRDGQTYYSHSQLAATTIQSAIAGFDNSLGLNNVKAATYIGSAESPSNPATDAFSTQIISTELDQNIFALSSGEIHLYQN